LTRRLNAQRGQSRFGKSHKKCTVRTNLCRVVGRAKDELRCSVVARANVRNVGLVLDEYLCTAEIAQLQNTAVGIEEQVLRLNVSVTDALTVNVGERTEQLVDVQLDLENWHGRLHLIEVARRTVDRLGNEFEHKIEVDLVLLESGCISDL
jgi:hypothetical protein